MDGFIVWHMWYTGRWHIWGDGGTCTVCGAIIGEVDICKIRGSIEWYWGLNIMLSGEIRVKIVKNWVTFYGMKLPRVGAFTEKWGSGYRNPVQILG